MYAYRNKLTGRFFEYGIVVVLSIHTIKPLHSQAVKINTHLALFAPHAELH